jgi:hypothetical protein
MAEPMLVGMAVLYRDPTIALGLVQVHSILNAICGGGFSLCKVLSFCTQCRLPYDTPWLLKAIGLYCGPPSKGELSSYIVTPSGSSKGRPRLVIISPGNSVACTDGLVKVPGA